MSRETCLGQNISPLSNHILRDQGDIQIYTPTESVCTWISTRNKHQFLIGSKVCLQLKLVCMKNQLPRCLY